MYVTCRTLRGALRERGNVVEAVVEVVVEVVVEAVSFIEEIEVRSAAIKFTNR